jgi:hypothetical protein
MSGGVEMIRPSFVSTAVSNIQVGASHAEAVIDFCDHYDCRQLPLSV